MEENNNPSNMRHVLWSPIFGLLVVGNVSPHALSQAEAVLYGRVTDEDGAALADANVWGAGTDRGVATEHDGHCRFDRIPPGQQILVVSAVGFRGERVPVMLEPGAEHHYDVSLKPTVLKGEEVVVTGTMRETHVKDSPVKVSVVSADRLQQSKTSANLMDLVGSVGGLSTQLNCGVCGTNAIRINDIEGPNTAVLIDGVPIMGALASVYGLNGSSPSSIDQVEVIRGPQSTRYGTQAPGGVVNVLTKNPTNTPSFSADACGQSTREGSVNLAASPEMGRFKGFVGRSALRMEHYFDENGDGFADVPKQSRVALFRKGTLSGGDRERRLKVAAKVYGEGRTGGTAACTDDLRGSDEVYGESIYTRRASRQSTGRPTARQCGRAGEPVFASSTSLRRIVRPLPDPARSSLLR